jgi:hypothetical protein
MSPTSSESKNKPDKKLLLATSFKLVSCFDYSPTLKMEVMCFIKTLAEFQQTA